MTLKQANPYGQMPYREESGLPPGSAMAGGGALASTGGMAYLNRTIGIKRDKDATGLAKKLVSDYDIDPADAPNQAKSLRGAAMKGRRLAGAGVIGGIGATMYGLNKLHDHFNKTSSYQAGYEMVMKVAKIAPIKAVKGLKGTKGVGKPAKIKPKGEISDDALDTAVKATTAIPLGAAGAYLYSSKK